MLDPENKLFRRLNTRISKGGEQQRLKALLELGLLQTEIIPVFEEATQTAAHFLDFPICILGFIDQNRLRVRSAVGLSRIGLMNKIAQERQLPRNESFCIYVVESQQVLAINDTHLYPDFATNSLVKDYGIRAFLGVPLIDSLRNCLGAIALMDLVPRTFSIQDIKFLEIVARWSMSEYEHNRLLKAQNTSTTKKAATKNSQITDSNNQKNIITPNSSLAESEQTQTSVPNVRADAPLLFSTIRIKLELLSQLTQELRTPLTSVLGMSSVVGREIYGPLTSKQKEYLEIIQHSAHYLLSLVNELTELAGLDIGTLNDTNLQTLHITSIDIEMLCQQAINTLSDAANQREQQIHLSVEPGKSRIWLLDKDKVRQLLYHMIFSVIQSATTGSAIHIHVSQSDNGLKKVVVWVSHPWLGEGLTQIDPYFCQFPVSSVVSDQTEGSDESEELFSYPLTSCLLPIASTLSSAQNLSAFEISASKTNANELEQGEITPRALFDRDQHQFNHLNCSRETLGLLLSCHLAELHGGKIDIQGTPESGYCYVVNLPELTIESEASSN